MSDGREATSGAILSLRLIHLDNPHHLLDALAHIDEAVQQLKP